MYKQCKILKLGVLCCFGVATLFSCLCSCSPSLNNGPSALNARPRGFVASVPNLNDLLGQNVILLGPLTPHSLPDNSGSIVSALNRSLQEVSNEECPLEMIQLKDQVLSQGALGSEIGLLLQKAREAGADSVLLVTLHEATEREGTRLEAEQGAKIDFTFVIKRVSDGKEIYSGSYHFADQPFSDNLFRARETFRKGGAPGFSTAQELFEEGLRSAWRDFVSRRTLAFSTKQM